MSEKKRVFSGIQPSGDIHIGNYLGAIRNWAGLLDDYECIFCIVDFHAMTIEYDISAMMDKIFNAAVVNIACGLDPERCTLFVQSRVPTVTELTWILNTITPMGELGRMTQFKDKAKQHHSNVNAGLFNYPVLMAADILLYRAEVVPVGEDQLQHLELSREICRKFNSRFGQYFPEPQDLLSPAPKILGLDGKKKMSKSMDNYIPMIISKKELEKMMLTQAVTDENRKRRNDPGDPDICNVHSIHKGFADDPLDPRVLEFDKACREGTIGCVDHKRFLVDLMWKTMGPIQDKAAELRSNPKKVREILAAGAERCQMLADETMTEVRKLIGIRK